MATRKITLKTAPKRRGTIPRSAIRRAVHAVFGAAPMASPTGRRKSAVKGAGSPRSVSRTSLAK